MLLLAAVVLMWPACSFSRGGALATKSPGTFVYGQDPAASSPPETTNPPSDGTAPNRGSGSKPPVKRPAGSAGGSEANSSGSGTGGSFPTFSEFGALGSAVCSLVRPGQFQKVNIEIDYVSGRAPSELAVSSLAASLKEVTGKSVGLAGGNAVTASGDGKWSNEEIKGLSEQRTVRTDTSSITLWVGFLDGSHSLGSHIVGSALGATTMVIFPDRYGAASGNLLSHDEVERTVLVHEAGHVLALLNIGFQSPRPHEDPDHKGHSKNRDSVMYYAVDTTDIGRIFTGTPPYQFDADDKADLADIAAGRITTGTCG